MSDNPTLTNQALTFSTNLNPDIPIAGDEDATGKIRQVCRIDFSTGTGTKKVSATDPLPVSSVPALVTFVVTRPSITNNTSTQVIASNSSRKGGSYLVNNTSATFYLNYGAAAVLSQGIPINPGDTFLFNTTQEIRGIQNSGGSLNLDVFEAT